MGQNERMPLEVYFIDRNPENRKECNLAVFCPFCRKQFQSANPEGLTVKNGLFAFAVNRDLYQKKLEF